MSNPQRAWAVGGGLAALLIAGATAFAADRHPAAAATTADAPSSVAPPSAAVLSSTAPSPAAATGPAGTAVTGGAGTPTLSAAETARVQGALVALAPRLPAHLTLTAPATWARYAGTTPQYAQDVTSCPHVATRLGAALGTPWAYASGKLPTAPVGCAWTPASSVAAQPAAARFALAIGYQSGRGSDPQAGSCADGAVAPRVAVPTVGQDAVLTGCDDGTGPSFRLAVPDAAGTGVWFFSATGGADVPAAHAADGLVAIVDAARHAYG